MQLCRRLFVVLLANNDHGKTTLVNSLLSQGLRAPSPGRKGIRELLSPCGCPIDAYVFVRAYQEVEKGRNRSVVHALDNNDPVWRERELIIFPSHIDNGDIDQMINAAHGAGFDAVCASVILTGEDGADGRTIFTNIWGNRWDERWTLPNPVIEQWQEQVIALGRDLWTAICRSLAI